VTAPGKKEAVIGPLRSLPRWDRVGVLERSTLRWEEGKQRRYDEFGSTKQWKTLSHFEAQDLYLLRRRDLEGIPFVGKYNVFGNARLTRFYVMFDVQDRALARWGNAAAIEAEQVRRRITRERRIARLQPPILMLLRPVRPRKGVVVVGSRAVGVAIMGNMGVTVVKLAGWASTGSGALLSEAFHSLADLGNQVCLLATARALLHVGDEPPALCWTLVCALLHAGNGRLRCCSSAVHRAALSAQVMLAIGLQQSMRVADKSRPCAPPTASAC
jgi:hypothetical protein